jgi:hypothetical protein
VRFSVVIQKILQLRMHRIAIRFTRRSAVRSFFVFNFASGLAVRLSVRQLNRQIGSQFYERIALSRNKAEMGSIPRQWGTRLWSGQSGKEHRAIVRFRLEKSRALAVKTDGSLMPFPSSSGSVVLDPVLNTVMTCGLGGWG